MSLELTCVVTGQIWMPICLECRNLRLIRLFLYAQGVAYPILLVPHQVMSALSCLYFICSCVPSVGKPLHGVFR